MSNYIRTSSFIGGLSSLAGAFYAKYQESASNESHKSCLLNSLKSRLEITSQMTDLYKKCGIGLDGIIRSGLKLIETIDATPSEGILDALDNHPSANMMAAHCEAYIKDPVERNTVYENISSLASKLLLLSDDCSGSKDHAENMQTLSTALLVGAAVFGTAYFVGPWLVKKVSQCRLPQMPQFKMPFRRAPQNPPAPEPSASVSSGNKSRSKPQNRGYSRIKPNAQPELPVAVPQKPTGSVSKRHGANYSSASGSSLEAEWEKVRKRAVTVATN